MSSDLRQSINMVLTWYWNEKMTHKEALERIMDLFRREAESGAAGQVNRLVGAPERAAGRQRNCPACHGFAKYISEALPCGPVEYECPVCKGTGEVCDPPATEGSAIEPDPESRGSPPLGPQARSGEALRFADYWAVQLGIKEEMQNEICCRDNGMEIIEANIADRLKRNGYAISRTDDGERSEHRGPNKQLSELAENEER